MNPPGLHVHLDPQLISGYYWTPKTCLLDTRKDHQFFVTVFDFGQQQSAARLRDGFHDQNTRHDWQVGKMAREKRLIYGDVLDGYDALLSLQVDNPVNEQERKAVRQDAQDILNIHGRLGRSLDCTLDRFTHFLPQANRAPRTDDYTVPRMKPKKSGQQNSAASGPNASERLQHFKQRNNDLAETVRQIAEIESPSDSKQAVDRLGGYLAGRFEKIGGHSKLHKAAEFGDHLQVDFEGAAKRSPVLLLGHLDTVYPLGTLKSMPCTISNGNLFGPGVLDMKSGIALMLHAIEALLAWNEDQLPRPVTVLLVSDEEIGSRSSRAITESLAKRSSAVLVMEPSYGPKGALKTARKGVGEYLVKVTGKAAHAGLDFEKGESAILELARQLTAMSKLVDAKHGVTLNPGIISGGTRSNVVPAEATAVVDVRVLKMKDAAVIDKKMRALRPYNRKCKLQITGGVNRPPMERSSGVVDLLKKAAAIAKEMNWKLDEAAVGGGSDGNYTAGLGIPTLDGLGGVGEGAHAAHENIVIAELPRRAALLAGLIERA